jgi:hypothetical protein
VNITAIPMDMVFFVPSLLIETATKGTRKPINSTLIVCAIDAVPLFHAKDLIMVGKITEYP